MPDLRTHLWATLLACLLLGFPGRAAAEDRLSAEQVRRQTLRATALVTGATGTEGTGWLVDSGRRLLVTSEHLTAGRDRVSVAFPFSRETGGGVRVIGGRVVTRDVRRDLAVVRLDDLPPGARALTPAAAGAEPGRRVYLAGNLDRGDEPLSFESGEIRQVRERTLKDRATGREIGATIVEVRVAAPVQAGFSGGPVLDEEGKVIGIMTMASAADRRVVWCVAAAEVEDVLRRSGSGPAGGTAPTRTAGDGAGR
jgi:S1-C subfamily serine protease